MKFKSDDFKSLQGILAKEDAMKDAQEAFEDWIKKLVPVYGYINQSGIKYYTTNPMNLSVDPTIIANVIYERPYKVNCKRHRPQLMDCDPKSPTWPSDPRFQCGNCGVELEFVEKQK